MTEHRIDLSALQSIRDGSGHSIFGASGSAMFLNCAGSLIPNLLAPDNAGEDAAYGTVAHAVGETWRRDGKKPRHLIGTNMFVESGDWGFLIDIDEVMLNYVQSSVDWSSLEEGEHLVEVRVDYSDLTPIPNQGGTLDFGAMRKGRGVIQDDKYGKNDPVMATENTQLMLYAYGVLREFGEKYNFKEFVLRISQPRLDHRDEWVISVKDLREWAQWAKERMHLAWQPNAPRTPGPKQCRWCKVIATCAANAKMQQDLVSEAFSGLTEYGEQEIQVFREELDIGLLKRTMDAMTLTTAEMAELKKYRKLSEAFWNALDKELLRRAVKEGEKIPGMKLVESRSHRQFKNKDVAAKKLIALGCDKDDVLKEVICSPAEAEKLLRKAGHRQKDLPELLAGLAHKPPGKPTLAPLSDKRAELADVSADAFADITDDIETTETD